MIMMMPNDGDKDDGADDCDVHDGDGGNDGIDFDDDDEDDDATILLFIIVKVIPSVLTDKNIVVSGYPKIEKVENYLFTISRYLCSTVKKLNHIKTHSIQIFTKKC